MAHLNISPCSQSVYTIFDNQQFIENWQDAVNEEGLTFWFNFQTGMDLYQSGNLETVVKIWSNRVQATVYVHYFRELEAFRVGQIYNIENAQQTRGAILIFKYDPMILNTQHPHPFPTNFQQDLSPSTATQDLNINTARINTGLRSIPTQHIRKPRNAWIIFRQEMMIKYRDQIGHLHTSEQSKVISQIWKKTPSSVKDSYVRRSQEEKAALLARYPNYKVQPRRSSDIKKRIKNKYPASMTVENLGHWIFGGDIQHKNSSGKTSGIKQLQILEPLGKDCTRERISMRNVQSKFEPQLASQIKSFNSNMSVKEVEIEKQLDSEIIKL